MYLDALERVNPGDPHLEKILPSQVVWSRLEGSKELDHPLTRR